MLCWVCAMFCGKCGNVIDENAAFCGKCGEPVKAAAEQPIEKEEQVQETVPVEEVKEPEIGAFASAEFDAAQQSPAPKKKKTGKLLLAIGLPVVAVMAAVAILLYSFGVFGGSGAPDGGIRNFATDGERFAYAEANALSNLSKLASTAYDAVFTKGAPMLGMSSSGGSFGYQGEVKLVLGEALTSLLSATSQTDFSWLKDIGYSFDMESAGSAQAVKCNIKLGGKSVVSLEALMDSAGEKMYMRIPELSDKYIAVPSAMPTLDAEMPAFVGTILDSYGDALPTADKVEALLNKYLKLALDNLPEVTAEDKEITVGNVAQTLTVMEVNVSEKDLAELVVVLLNEVKNDQEIKGIIDSAMQAFGSDMFPSDDIDGYAAFTQELDDLIEYMNEAVSASSDEVMLTLRDYVNEAHAIVGRDVSFEGQEVLSYVVVENGGNMAVDCDVASVVTVNGEGTKNGDAVTCELDVVVEGKELCTVSLKDFNANAMTGTARVEVGEGLMQQMGAGSMSMMSFGLEFVFKGANALDCNLMSGDSVLVGFQISGGEKSGVGAVSLPDSSQALEPEQWATTANFDALLNNLKAAGVPEELFNSLGGLLTGDALIESNAASSYEDMYMEDYSDLL